MLGRLKLEHEVERLLNPYQFYSSPHETEYVHTKKGKEKKVECAAIKIFLRSNSLASWALWKHCLNEYPTH